MVLQIQLLQLLQIGLQWVPDLEKHTHTHTHTHTLHIQSSIPRTTQDTKNLIIRDSSRIFVSCSHLEESQVWWAAARGCRTTW